MAELASLDRDVGRFDEALTGYEQALDRARTPTLRAEVLDELKSYYQFRGQFGDAIRTMDTWLEAVSTAWTPVQIVRERFPNISIFVDAGRYGDAVALFEELRSQLPAPLTDYVVPHWEIHIALAAEDGEAARGAHHGAMDAMEATESGALLPALTADLGRVDELDGDYESAVRNYREAMTLDPGRNVHREAGRALRKAGRLDEAEAELREALRLRPAEPRAHLEMALVLEVRGDTAGALEHLQSALAAWEPADESYDPAREARALLAALTGAD